MDRKKGVSMKTFIQNLRLSRKMLIAPGLMLFFFLVIAAGSYFGLRQQQDALRYFVDDGLRSSVMIDRATQNILGAQGNIYKMITWGQAGFDQAKIEAVGKAQFSAIDSALILLKSLADMTAEPGLKGKYAEAFEAAGKYRKAAATVVDLGTVDLNSATMAMVNAEEKFADLSARLAEARDIESTLSGATYAAASSTYHTMLWMFVGVLVLSVALSVVVTLWVTRIIVAPLETVNQILGRVADGNVSLKDGAQRIAAGDVSGEMTLQSEEVTIRQNDEVGMLAESTRKIVASQDELADAFRRVAVTLDALMKETTSLAASAVEGRLAARGDESKFAGGYRAVVKGVNDTLDAVIGPLNVAARYVDAISKGNIPEKITQNYHGDFNTIKNNLNVCILAIEHLVADARFLSEEAVKGKLSVRADVGKHQGDFRAVVEGVNATLDALTGPMAVAADSIDRISKGVIPEKITEAYRGDFNTLKDNINRCIDGLGGLVEANAVLQRMAVNDYTRRVEGAYPGIFAEVAKATNEVREHLIRLLDIAKNISKGDLSDLEPLKATGNGTGRRCEQDELVPAYVQMEEAIKRLVEDTGSLSAAAVDGQLNFRAEVGRHQGEFRKVLEGVNRTLDAVIKPVEDGGRVLALVAAGDLSARVTGQYRGDHRKIASSINEVASSLDKALTEVWEAVSATASASNEISASTEEMAAGAQEQTNQTSEVAGAVEEMSKTILQNAQNASATASVAKQAKASAESGGTIVSETVAGMRRIAEVVERSAQTVKGLGASSDQIGEIVTVIDDIADQTNLLALNAAIEAARAGDQGRGFAVVADEVRKLAERTTKATKEIAEMIRKIQSETRGAVHSMEEGTKQVNAGILLADQAGGSLLEIVQVSQKVTDMVLQIAAASEQQSTASEQISKNVEAISSVTSQTASGTHQIARAANDLNTLTENLQQLIGRFRLSKDVGAAPGGDGARDPRSNVAVRANGKLVGA